MSADKMSKSSPAVRKKSRWRSFRSLPPCHGYFEVRETWFFTNTGERTERIELKLFNGRQWPRNEFMATQMWRGFIGAAGTVQPIEMLPVPPPSARARRRHIYTDGPHQAEEFLDHRIPKMVTAESASGVKTNYYLVRIAQVAAMRRFGVYSISPPTETERKPT